MLQYPIYEKAATINSAKSNSLEMAKEITSFDRMKFTKHANQRVLNESVYSLYKIFSPKVVVNYPILIFLILRVFPYIYFEVLLIIRIDTQNVS